MVTAADVATVEVDTVGVRTADGRKLGALVNVDVTAAARPAALRAPRTTGNDVTRGVGRAPTPSLAVGAPSTRRTRCNII